MEIFWLFGALAFVIFIIWVAVRAEYKEVPRQYRYKESSSWFDYDYVYKPTRPTYNLKPFDVCVELLGALNKEQFEEVELHFSDFTWAFRVKNDGTNVLATFYQDGNIDVRVYENGQIFEGRVVNQFKISELNLYDKMNGFIRSFLTTLKTCKKDKEPKRIVGFAECPLGP